MSKKERMSNLARQTLKIKPLENEREREREREREGETM